MAYTSSRVMVPMDSGLARGGVAACMNWSADGSMTRSHQAGTGILKNRREYSRGPTWDENGYRVEDEPKEVIVTKRYIRRDPTVRLEDVCNYNHSTDRPSPPGSQKVLTNRAEPWVNSTCLLHSQSSGEGGKATKAYVNKYMDPRISDRELEATYHQIQAEHDKQILDDQARKRLAMKRMERSGTPPSRSSLKRHDGRTGELHSSRYDTRAGDLHSSRFDGRAGDLHTSRYDTRARDIHSSRYDGRAGELQSSRYDTRAGDLHSSRYEAMRRDLSSPDYRTRREPQPWDHKYDNHDVQHIPHAPHGPNPSTGHGYHVRRPLSAHQRSHMKQVTWDTTPRTTSPYAHNSYADRSNSKQLSPWQPDNSTQRPRTYSGASHRAYNSGNRGVDGKDPGVSVQLDCPKDSELNVNVRVQSSSGSRRY